MQQLVFSGMRRLLVVSTLLVSGCAAETVVHGLNEKEANTIIEVLADNDVQGTKLVNATGREVVYDIAVPGGAKLQAIRVLNRHELPRRRDRGYMETFSESGLIPTSAEEKAKRLAALEGEIERQLKLIDGILDVQVQIVMPDESALRTTKEQEPATTASVTIKYLPGANGARPLSEPEVQAIVAAGVEKLSPEQVAVLMRAAGGPAAELSPATASKAPVTQKQLLIGVSAFLLVIVLLGIGLVFTQVRLRTVRGRLVRLQNEIAKAKKKPGEALPPGGQQAAS